MVCPTCMIPCGTICPSCLENVFSEWHQTQFAVEFGKTITDEQRKYYRSQYEKNVKVIKKPFFLKRLFGFN